MKAAWIAYQTIVIREALRFIRIWVQTVVPPAMTMGLYFVIFGSLIGERMGPMQGVSYVDYLAPGLILMGIITHSYANTVSSFYTAKYHRNIEEMLVAPTPNFVILAGYVTGGVMRGIAVAAVVTLVALPFADLRIAHPGVVIGVVLLTSVLFAIGGLINAIYAKSFDDISIIPTFVLTPLTYLGGVFYSIELLSEPWQSLSLANPILYMVNALRYGMLGVSDVSVLTAFAIVGAFILALGAFALHLLERGAGVKQ